MHFKNHAEITWTIMFCGVNVENSYTIPKLLFYSNSHFYPKRLTAHYIWSACLFQWLLTQNTYIPYKAKQNNYVVMAIKQWIVKSPARTCARNVHATDAPRPLNFWTPQTQRSNVKIMCHVLRLVFLLYFPFYTFTDSCKLAYLPVQFSPPTSFTTLTYKTTPERRLKLNLFNSWVMFFHTVCSFLKSRSSMWR